MLPMLRMAWGTDVDGRKLDQAERAMFAVFAMAIQGAAMAEYAQSLDQAEEARIRAKLQKEFMEQPHLRQVGPCLLAAGWANPPRPSATVPGGVTTAPPSTGLRPDNGFQTMPGLYTNPVQ